MTLMLLFLSGFLFFQNVMMKMRLAFAEDQIEIFQSMEASALKSSPEEAVKYMEYAINYYPSGTKQNSGTFLDRIVEKERKMAIGNIISYLQNKTGENLGNKPEKWIKKYRE